MCEKRTFGLPFDRKKYCGQKISEDHHPLLQIAGVFNLRKTVMKMIANGEKLDNYRRGVYDVDTEIQGHKDDLDMMASRVLDGVDYEDPTLDSDFDLADVAIVRNSAERAIIEAQRSKSFAHERKKRAGEKHSTSVEPKKSAPEKTAEAV